MFYKNLRAPPKLSKTRAKSVKMKVTKFFILNKYLYWKDTGGILFNYLLRNESGLDFIGEINPNSSSKHKWILTSTYYFTKWIESIPTRRDTYIVIIGFLENGILSRLGVPRG